MMDRQASSPAKSKPAPPDATTNSTTIAAKSGASATAVRNPYLKAQHRNSDVSGNAAEQPRAQLLPGNASGKEEGEPASNSKLPASETKLQVDAKLPNHETKDSTTDKTDIASTTASAQASTAASSATTRSGLPYWERLPSKQVSFGPAEVLTVQECIQHASCYNEASVRITGQVSQRYVANERSDALQGESNGVETLDYVVLEVMDPISIDLHNDDSDTETSRFASETPAKRKLFPSLSTPRASLPQQDSGTKVKNHRSTPSSSATSTASLKTPATITQNKTLGPRRSLSSSLSRRSSGSAASTTTGSRVGFSSAKRKRPWFATTSNKATPRRILSSTKKAPSTSKGSQKPTQNLPRMLQVWVDPTWPRLPEIQASSKVMVIGTLTKLPETQMKATPFSYRLMARLVTPLPSTVDMKTYVQALQLRRRYMYQRRKGELKSASMAATEPADEAQSEKLSTTDNKEARNGDLALSAIKPIQGCGPPPYNDFESSS